MRWSSSTSAAGSRAGMTTVKPISVDCLSVRPFILAVLTELGFGIFGRYLSTRIFILLGNCEVFVFGSKPDEYDGLLILFQT